jgi:small subunit ribosomal protein S20
MAPLQVAVPTPLDWFAGTFYVSRSVPPWPESIRLPGGFHVTVQSGLQEFFVPNIQSAKKDLRKSRAAAVRNRAQRSALRTAVKKAKTATAAGDDRLKAVSLLDRAARKGLIHKNAAARQKSKLAKLANKAVAA